MKFDHLNLSWMQYFNKHRYLHAPIASEWQRLSIEYLTINQKCPYKPTPTTVSPTP